MSKILLPISLVRPQTSPSQITQEVIRRCDSTGVAVPPAFREHAKLLAVLEAEDALLYIVQVGEDGYATGCELAPLEASVAAWRLGQRA